MSAAVTMYDELGEERLRRIVDVFVDRVFDDVMIGYLFRDVDRERLKRMELQFAARHLGGPVRYEGKPIREAHAPHPIFAGHFNRRRELLRRTLEEHDVPAHIVEHWIAHTESLRAQVTRDAAGRCEPPDEV
ncbi:MAG TPA: group 1 truncated hemoglobin [Myxococcota bacterium]|nr:group 1 truncated hemoglobin [Myxococcota bacterium]